jgi:hypothetical protein
MGGGAWPFLVGGATCLVNSVNERDLLEWLERAAFAGALCLLRLSVYFTIETEGR